MITVRVCYREGNIFSISLTGHGGGEYGKDLVCAGVSACFIGALTDIVEKNEFDCKVKSGDSSLQAVKKVSEHDEVVLETLIMQLQTIADSNPKNLCIKVSRKEG